MGEDGPSGVEGLRRSAPALYTVLTTRARLMYGRGLDELGEEELAELVEKTYPRQARLLLRLLGIASSPPAGAPGGEGRPRLYPLAAPAQG